MVNRADGTIHHPTDVVDDDNSVAGAESASIASSASVVADDDAAGTDADGATESASIASSSSAAAGIQSPSSPSYSSIRIAPKRPAPTSSYHQPKIRLRRVTGQLKTEKE